MKQESGRSMIEMLGVLAIMFVLTAAAATLVTRGFAMQKRMQVNEDVVSMVTNVRQVLGEYDDFSHINNATIFDVIGVSRKNPYGGDYGLAVDVANPRQFVVSIGGLSESDCKYFVEKPWSDSVGYQTSGGKNSGATSNCAAGAGKNIVYITYGE